MQDFIKNYGSLVMGAIIAFFTILYKAVRVVHQGELLNQRLELLEKQFDKISDKLDRVIDVRYDHKV
jgi:hypothetical protein